MILSETVIEFLIFRIGTALAAMILSAILIGYTSGTFRTILSRKFDNDTVLDLLESGYRFIAWFSVILVVLSLLGFSEIAAAFGTAAGFVALGISFALKNLISDTVAGIYLAKDPDFNKGDIVNVDDITGKIEEVGLRKSRIRMEDGNLRVVNNSDAERRWTLIDETEEDAS